MKDVSSDLYCVLQVVVWAIDQDKKGALLEEMRRLKVDFRFFEEKGDDEKGSVKKWMQLAGKYTSHFL